MSVTAISGPIIEDPLFATLDYIPLVSSISGVARAAFGLLETTVGVVVLPIQMVQRLCNVQHRFLFNLGISNMVRGTISFVPIAGNITVYIYDHLPNTRADVQNLFGLSKFT